jgi:hypothetical protein
MPNSDFSNRLLMSSASGGATWRCFTIVSFTGFGARAFDIRRLGGIVVEPDFGFGEEACFEAVLFTLVEGFAVDRAVEAIGSGVGAFRLGVGGLLDIGEGHYDIGWC